MKAPAVLRTLHVVAASALVLLVCWAGSSDRAGKGKFPYQQAGLSKEEAARHLLSRFSFGPRPGEVDRVVKLGLEKWFSQQLRAAFPDDSLERRLAPYAALRMPNSQLLATYPRPGYVARMAVKDGFLAQDAAASLQKPAYRNAVQEYRRQKGYRPQQELFRQLIGQKILRAAYSENQLREVMTDFWFNHFNVSLTKNQAAAYVLSYERDAIRPNALGKFESLLLATAKSPAMLYFLDNASSAAEASARPGQDAGRLLRQGAPTLLGDSSGGPERRPQVAGARKARGLNENYAREVMELHTLGVDGGYTQTDVTQAAKVLTGWTVFPLGENAANNPVHRLLARVGEEKLASRGYVREGDFLFNPTRHEPGPKVVLGNTFAGAGYPEGVALLHLLAHHPATATFICRKLAIRFVADVPPPSLVEKMANTFLAKDGDIRAVLTTMVSSPEFWRKEAVREKTKSPFELIISAVRGLQAEVQQPYALFTWMSRMGQKIYYYQAPTGFPDRAQYWISTGALLNRMNFGLAMAAGQIPGVRVNLLALNQNHEPESAAAALAHYSALLLPEQEVAPTVKRLSPLLLDPQWSGKVEAAAVSTAALAPPTVENAPVAAAAPSGQRAGTARPQPAGVSNGTLPLAQVVGVIIGSPAFQRR